MFEFYKKTKISCRWGESVNTDDFHTTGNSDMTAYISKTTLGKKLALSSDGVLTDFKVWFSLV